MWGELVESECSERSEVAVEQRGRVFQLAFHAVQDLHDPFIELFVGHAVEVGIDKNFAIKQLEDLYHVHLVERARLTSEDAEGDLGSMRSEQRGEASRMRGQSVPAVEHNHHVSECGLHNCEALGKEANSFSGRRQLLI